ncbi:MAG: molybdenum cofactor guanylyltransferase [Anaerolineae bacterium]|nr:molybdenum cofactor guanylyltransferase [Anaerolineae bacterium]MDW8102925.1 molybdenum cofactor guanylyltransferase [Anaerolineae bacterium]
MISVAILAGGLSSRMGFNKALAPWHGRPLIEHILHRVKALSDDVFIVAKSPEIFNFTGVRVVKDVVHRYSSLVGIYSALREAYSHHCLVVACDMPFLNLDLLRYLAALAPHYDVVMPLLKRGPEPLHAVYSKNCLGPIEKLLAEEEDKILLFLPAVRVRYVEEDIIRLFDPALSSFVNINTPEELEEVRKKEEVKRWLPSQ